MHRIARIGVLVPATCLLLAAVALGAAAAQGVLDSPRIVTFFKRLGAQPDNFARLRYANMQRGSDNPQLRQIAGQILVTEWSMFGRIGEAEAAFTISQKPEAATAPLPVAADWSAVPAVDYIAAAAADRRLVVVNEAHHRPQTRLLTLALLPKLRAEGYDHVAIEALDPADTALASRGYPTEKSGYYTQEPLYGEIVREANGLAMSSRNQYLSEAERATAAVIHRTLLAMREGTRAGTPRTQVEAAADAALREAGFVPDYAVVRRPDFSEPVDGEGGARVALIAAKLGRTRLIDNIEFWSREFDAG